MKGIKRIGNSKVPTIDQLERMARNLQIAYPKSYTNINADVMTYFDGDQRTKYWLSVEGRKGAYRDWPETLAEYRRLMKESKNV